MRIGILNLTYKNSIIKEHQPNNKMNQEQKDYLLKVEAEISKMFYEIHDLLSEETTYAMADGLDALSSEVMPLWEEKVLSEPDTWIKE